MAFFLCLAGIKRKPPLCKVIPPLGGGIVTAGDKRGLLRGEREVSAQADGGVVASLLREVAFAEQMPEGVFPTPIFNV